MSDIVELVIDIPEEVYKDTVKLRTLFDEYIEDVRDAIIEGTPLPKGHGRLFDERDVVNGNYEVIGNRIYGLETLLEEDKEINADGDSN